MIRLFALLCLEVFFECERLLETQLEKIGVRGVLGFFGSFKEAFLVWFVFFVVLFLYVEKSFKALVG